jgi:hypothetical protein
MPGVKKLLQSVDDQRSEFRNRRSEVSRQNSEVSCQRPHFLARNTEQFRLFDHAAQHSATDEHRLTQIHPLVNVILIPHEREKNLKIVF